MKSSSYMQSQMSSLFTSSLFTVSVHIVMCIDITYIFTALQTLQLKHIVTDTHTEDIYTWSLCRNVAGVPCSVVMVYTPAPQVLTTTHTNDTSCATTPREHETKVEVKTNSVPQVEIKPYISHEG